MPRAAPANDYGITSDRWEHVRSALVFYFMHHYAIDPEDLAQETITRVVGKLASGQTIVGESGFEKFCYTFAGFVLKESRRRRTEETLPDTLPVPATKTLGLDDLDFNLYTGELLDKLDEQERTLIEHAERGDLAELAQQLGVPVETLRVRVSRVRDKLRHLRDGTA